MQCLLKYKWVKLMRSHLPKGKGIMGAWSRLAARAAFRKGEASYCGHRNAVSPGMWAGGVVGLKSILGVRSRAEALQTLEQLSRLGYLQYDLNEKTKKLTYKITDWVVQCSGEECMNGAVYATDGFGFLCLPRNITERLAEQNYIFEEADAWMDLWCHTVSEDSRNAFSFLAPVCQFGKFGALLTLETLGQRWNWEKTKVWRFMKKHGDVFSLYRLPGSYGCLIFNSLYPTGTEVSLPTHEKVVCILDEIRIYAANASKHGSEHEHMSRMVTWFSKRLLEDHARNDQAKPQESRVALLGPIYRAYLSQCRNCKNCNNDCHSKSIYPAVVLETANIRGPCNIVDLTKIAKENFAYEEPTIAV